MRLPESMLPMDPLTGFVIVMFIILIFPKLLEKVKAPGILGLVAGGFIIGPAGIGLISPESHTFHQLADIGKLMVMFFAGLEIDFEEFVTNWRKSLTFGSLTFILPLITGLTVALISGYSILTAILIGSLLASHTLIAIPILMKYGLMKKQSVNIAIGATIFTDVAALFLLAVIVSIHTVGFNPTVLFVRLGGMLIYFPLVLFGARWIAGHGMKIKAEEHNQTVFIILIMTVAAVGAEIIHLEGIVGAFVGGLAVSEVIRGGAAKKSLENVANTLFIPMFFIAIGSMIAPGSFLGMSLRDYLFAGGIIAGLIAAKFAAARISARLLAFPKTEGNLMWALSTPQMAATIAAALVARESINSDGQALINETVFDIILMLMAVTAIIGPLLAEKFSHLLKDNCHI
jgi:Kef-type K+ transport system membrane component KefB